MDLEKLIWPGAASLGGTDLTKGYHLNMPVSADWSSCSEHCVEDSEPASEWQSISSGDQACGGQHVAPMPGTSWPGWVGLQERQGQTVGVGLYFSSVVPLLKLLQEEDLPRMLEIKEPTRGAGGGSELGK